MKYYEYLKKQYLRKKLRYRIGLGLKQFVRTPLLNLLWIPVIIATILVFWGKTIAMNYLINDIVIPQMIYFVFSCIMTFIIVLFLICLIFGMFEWIGERTARGSESCLVIAFDAKHLKHGHPILIDKYRIKGTNVIVREFYTRISYKSWIEKKDAIADVMNAHFVEEIQYGGKNNADGNRIIIKTAKGRKTTEQGGIYDEDF